MNAFYEHHKDSIRFAYRCFDRILLHATIQPFQQEQRAVGFFWTYRQIYPVSRQVLRDIATQYHNWAKNRSQKWGVPIQEDPQGWRTDFVERYFRRAQPDQVVAIIKARKPASILKAIGKDDRWHLELRWVEQYNFVRLSQSALLAGPAHAGAWHPLSAVRQRLLASVPIRKPFRNSPIPSPPTI